MSEKAKILYVVQNLSGGVLTYLVDLTDRLIDRYDIAIAFALDQDSPQDIRSMFSPKIPMHSMTTFLHEGNMIRESQARSELKEIVKEEKPDIIHMHGYKAGKIGRKALDGMGIPLFYTPHGYMYLSEDHNMLSRSMYRANEAAGARAECMTIATSKGEFAETLNFTRNATYVNNGLNLPELDSYIKDLTPAEHPFTVFTSGRINAQKNPDLFNEIAMAMPDVHFVWIGDGMLKYKLTAPNIEITGWLSRKEAMRRSFNSDVFILTSRWEGLPLSLLEAMYLQKLAIASNVIGSRDVIENGVNGYIVDTAASFVNALNHARDPQAKTLVENAYQDIVNNYNIDKMADEYDRIYQEALAKKF